MACMGRISKKIRRIIKNCFSTSTGLFTSPSESSEKSDTKGKSNPGLPSSVFLDTNEDEISKAGMMYFSWDIVRRQCWDMFCHFTSNFKGNITIYTSYSNTSLFPSLSANIKKLVFFFK